MALAHLALILGGAGGATLAQDTFCKRLAFLQRTLFLVTEVCGHSKHPPQQSVQVTFTATLPLFASLTSRSSSLCLNIATCEFDTSSFLHVLGSAVRRIRYIVSRANPARLLRWLLNACRNFSVQPRSSRGNCCQQFCAVQYTA